MTHRTSTVTYTNTWLKEEPMQLHGKTIGLLVGPGYEDLEFWVPYMRMKEEGAEVLYEELQKVDPESA